MDKNEIPEFLQVEIDGRIYLQVRCDASRWGFYITDGKQVWDGGFGLVKYVGQNKPAKKKSRRLEKLAQAIACGEYFPVFHRNELMDIYDWILHCVIGY